MEDAYKLVIVDEENIEYYGKGTAGSFHSQYLYDYIKERYGDDPIFSKLNDKVPYDQLACFLVFLKNKVILLNETKLDNNNKPRYGTFACMVLPKNMSKKLLDNIKKIRNLDYFNTFVIENVTLDNDNTLVDYPISDYDDLPINDRLNMIYHDLNKNNEKTR